MRTKIILPLFMIFLSIQARAQVVENNINVRGTNFPQEKIHIHFDKASYLPGETVWFKAYVFEESLPSERSTNLYTALYDESGKLLQQVTSPIFGSSSEGQFTIPDTLQSTQVICRAYTAWMLNFDSSFLFHRALKIINNRPVAQTDKGTLSTSLRFFPEGGEIIEGVVNTIAFKSTYHNGLPFYADGVIKKQETGEVVMALPVMHDGMGKFNLDFQPGDRFVVEWVDHNAVKQVSVLPAAKSRGVALKLTVQKDKLYYNLLNRSGADSLHVLMYMYQKVFYKANLAVAAAVPFTGMVPIGTLPTGTMQITVFDANWQPVAERVAFINNNVNINAALNSRQVSTAKRAKNELEILVADTMLTNMSLSVTDADMNDGTAPDNILTDLLLKGDLKGYIHNPAYYFSSNADPALKEKLDLLMLTNGWRRYHWPDVMAGKNPSIKTPADEYLMVYGQLGKEALGKMEKDETINLIVKAADSTNSFYSVMPEKSGTIRQAGLVFYDSARVYYTFNKSKALNKQMAFSRSNFTLNQPLTVANYRSYLLPDSAGTGYGPNIALFKYYTANGSINFNTEKTMQGVVIKTTGRRNWQNDPIVKLDQKYASGMFSGGANSYSLDVLHDEKAWTKLDFYAYIRSMVPGLVIGSYNLQSGRSLTYAGLPVLVYIDEHEMTTSDLENLSLTQVAYIKMIPNFSGRGADAGGRSINPAISVYTRKGDDLIDRSPKETDINMVKVAGYSPIKEFYSPDHSKSNATGGTDARITLLWMPYIFTDAKTRKVPVIFYNNDFTKKMRVVLEGMNEEGKMIHIEKIIE